MALSARFPSGRSAVKSMLGKRRGGHNLVLNLDDLIDGGGCGQVPGGEIILSALLELDLTPSRPGHLSGHPPTGKT